MREYRARPLKVQRVSSATINRRLVVLRLLPHWERHEGMIEGDSVNGIQLVPQVKPAPRLLDRQEQYALRRLAEKNGIHATSRSSCFCSTRACASPRSRA